MNTKSFFCVAIPFKTKIICHLRVIEVYNISYSGHPFDKIRSIHIIFSIQFRVEFPISMSKSPNTSSRGTGKTIPT